MKRENAQLRIWDNKHMKRPSKQEIKAEVERLREKPVGAFTPIEQKGGKLAPKKSSQRIRKQGV